MADAELAAFAATGIAQWAWLIPVLTAASFVAISGAGKRLWNGGAAIAIAGTGAALLIALGIIVQVLRTPDSALPMVQEIRWLDVGGMHFDVGVYIDHLTALMLLVVAFIGFLIVVYSTAYMHGEAGIRRYFAEICLFVTGMLGLVLANDFLLLFIMWEIMGLCSYLLIGFWYAKPEAASAAKKAFLVTRVGDVFFFVGLVICGVTFGTTNMRVLFSAAAQFAAGQGGLFAGHLPEITTITLLFFGGSMGKSAQFPLHVWLPDAMEGPTTVSALIHAATMVKAGVYLVARAYPLFALAPLSLTVVAVVGAFTAFFAATMALVATDIKRVLAYSTISQLSYMFLGLGAGAIGAAGYAGYTAGVFHLSTHAFTKALLFLGAGSVIHAVHTNDMREMGGLRKVMPVTSLVMLVGALSLSGFPGFSIFWSKDAVLESAMNASAVNPLFLALFALGALTALMTAFYTFRMWFMTFWGDYRGHAHPHESPPAMTVPLILLAVFALGWGAAMVASGFGGFVFFGEPETTGLLAALVNPVSLLSMALAMLGIGLAYAMYALGKPSPARVSGAAAPVVTLLENRYYMDKGYDWFAGRAYVAFASGIDWFDRSVIDGIVNGLAIVHLRGSEAGRKLQSGNVQDYAAAILVGLVVVVFVGLYLVNPQNVLHQRLFGALGGP